MCLELNSTLQNNVYFNMSRSMDLQIIYLLYEPSSWHSSHTYLPILFLFGMLSFVGHTRVRPFKRLGHLLSGPQSVPMQAYPLCEPCRAALGRHLLRLQRRILFPLRRWIVAESAAGPDPGLSWLLSWIYRVDVYPYLPVTVGWSGAGCLLEMLGLMSAL